MAVVNEAYARRYFAGRAAVGQALAAKVRGTARQLTIVGVAEDTRSSGLREPPPLTVYVAYTQLPDEGRRHLLVRGTGGTAALARTIETVIRAAMPGTPFEAQPLAAQVGATLIRERVLALLAAGFGLLALLLAAIGLYGLVAYGVTERTQELGVRLALGARRSQMLRLVLADGMRLVASASLLGVPAAWARITVGADAALRGHAGRSGDAVGFALAVLVGAALVAAYLPARRAARTDPLVALRHD